jgi:hypothetical protein
MLKVKRDTEEVSNARASHADLKDISLLSIPELRDLLAASPEDEDLLLLYACKAGDCGRPEDVRFALNIDKKTVVTRCPLALVQYLLQMQGRPDVLSAADLLYLGRWSEQNSAEQALWMYDLIKTGHPDCPELEMALLRSATIQWSVLRECGKALAALDYLLSKFPNGATLFEAEDLRDAIVRFEEKTLPRAA